MAYKSPKQILAEAPKIPQAIKDKAIPALLTDVEQKKFLNQATSELSPLKQAFLGGIEASKKQLDLDTETLKSGLRQQAQSEQTQLAQRLSSSGFLRSGEQIGGGQQITGRLTESLSQADINRAKSLADLALQSAQFEADISAEAQRRANELGVQEMKRREYEAEIARQQIADIREERDIFLQEEMAEQEFRRNLALSYAKSAATTSDPFKGFSDRAVDAAQAMVDDLNLQVDPKTGKKLMTFKDLDLLRQRISNLPDLAKDLEFADEFTNMVLRSNGIDELIPEGAYNTRYPSGYTPPKKLQPGAYDVSKPGMTFSQALQQQFSGGGTGSGLSQSLGLNRGKIDTRSMLGL